MTIWTKAHKFYRGRYAVTVGGILVGTGLTWNQAQGKAWRHKQSGVWEGEVEIHRLLLNPRWDGIYRRR